MLMLHVIQSLGLIFELFEERTLTDVLFDRQNLGIYCLRVKKRYDRIGGVKIPKNSDGLCR